MTPLDWVVLIGGPVAFLAFALTLVFVVLGPGPDLGPIEKIRRGEVKVGMTVLEVESKIGRPKGSTPREDGGFTYRYQHGTAEMMVEEDAYLEFNPDGFLMSISIERVSVPVPTASPR